MRRVSALQALPTTVEFGMAVLMFLFVCLCSPVSAGTDAEAPRSWTHISQAVGVAAFPLGVLSETKVDRRWAMYRSPSGLLDDSYIAVGPRVAVTPAFVEMGGRFSVAPIQFFQVDVLGSWRACFPGVPFGLQPFSEPRGRTQEDLARLPLAPGGWVASLSIAPTLKLRFGPFVALYMGGFHFLQVGGQPDATSPYVFDAFRGQVIGRSEVQIEHVAGLLVELMNGLGPKGGMLRVGVAVRDRLAVRSGDNTTVLGPIIMLRPNNRPATPMIYALVGMYLRDPDRVGTPPYIGIFASWDGPAPTRSRAGGTSAWGPRASREATALRFLDF